MNEIFTLKTASRVNSFSTNQLDPVFQVSSKLQNPQSNNISDEDTHLPTVFPKILESLLQLVQLLLGEMYLYW